METGKRENEAKTSYTLTVSVPTEPYREGRGGVVSSGRKL